MIEGRGVDSKRMVVVAQFVISTRILEINQKILDKYIRTNEGYIEKCFNVCIR